MDALANVAGITIDLANEIATDAGRRKGRSFHSRKLIARARVLGYRFRKLRMKPRTLAKVLREHPVGRFYAVKSQHAFAIVDGLVLDTSTVELGVRVRHVWEYLGEARAHAGLSAILPAEALASAAANINANHELAQRAAGMAVQHAIVCGQLLIEAKSKIPHGEWLAWVSENCDFDQRTARGYMQLAELPAEKRRLVADMGLRQALKEIADPAKKKPAAPAPKPEQVHVERHHRDDLAVEVDPGEQHHDGNPETSRALTHRRELAALLYSWERASADAREQFVALKSGEIAAVYQKREAAA